MSSAFGTTHVPFNELMAGQSPADAAKRLLASSLLADKEKVKALLEKTPDEILASNDPWISYVMKSADEATAMSRSTGRFRTRSRRKCSFLVWWSSVSTGHPSHRTRRSRFASPMRGQGYNYNGTVAPAQTTFYGMFDRHYSYSKPSPWTLPDIWLKAGAEFDKSTPLNFVSTSDIIGGNSGSPVINKDLQLVGIAFDGTSKACRRLHLRRNGESLRQRSFVGDSRGRQDVYKAERLAKELKAGKIEN